MSEVEQPLLRQSSVDPQSEREVLIAFVQRAASQRRAICQLDHHAATCRGAVRLAEEAAKVLASLGIEPRYPQGALDEPCPVCGENEYIIGQVWRCVWVHGACLAQASNQGDPRNV